MVTNPMSVGRVGTLYLVADRKDIEAGNLNGNAATYNTRTGRWSEVKPLQVWFKFIFLPDDPDDAGLQEALKSSDALPAGA